MRARNFSEAEQALKGLFESGRRFRFRGRDLVVLFSEKPTCAEGEPKTDVFVRCLDESSRVVDIKISYKKVNADFIENKMTAERAQEIFGPGWVSRITQATDVIRDGLARRRLIFKTAAMHAQAGSITVGWKFELLWRHSGDLSGSIALSTEEKRDVFAGCNLPQDKRDAYVGEQIISNSGIADYILVSDRLVDLQETVDCLIPVEDFAVSADVYFACKALNLRTYDTPPKWDGNRPLAVQVDWEVREGRLTPFLDYDHPLIRRGNELVEKLQWAMGTLGVSNVSQLNHLNCACCTE